jgi:hypothetical protein
MSNLYDWAERELNRVLETCNDSESCEMQKQINKDILDIVKVFSWQGHSGFSAGYVIRKITRLLDWKTITPLTGEESEWSDCYADDTTQQNLRCSAVFRKNKDNSTAYYINGKVFSDNGGHTWFSSHKSRVPVTFPYNVPDNPEYIYLNGENSEEIITDPNRIKELYDAWEREHN